MTLGTTLKTVEKKFGPCLPGQGEPNKTVSALRYAAGKGRKFAGIPGIHPDAVFYVHFPMPVDLSAIKSKKGVFDFISDLKEDGPQSDQGRDALVDAFMAVHGKEFRIKKLSAAKHVVIEIEGERFEVPAKIAFSKKTKALKVTAQFAI